MARTIKTVNIRGKQYAEVSERVKAFRDEHPEWSLTTNIVSIDDACVVMQAIIADESGRTIAVGTAQEFRQSSNINATSYVENCETSAWGRALANLGYGIDGTICSAQELITALSQQGEKVEVKPTAAELKVQQMPKKAAQTKPAPQEHDASDPLYIAGACSEFDFAQTKEVCIEVWSKYPDLQRNREFCEAKNRAKVRLSI